MKKHSWSYDSRPGIRTRQSERRETIGFLYVESDGSSTLAVGSKNVVFATSGDRDTHFAQEGYQIAERATSIPGEVYYVELHGKDD